MAETWGFGDQDQLSVKWALALGYHVGFRGDRLITAVALMTAESQRYPGAWHHNIKETLNQDGEVVATTIDSTDRGLFQVNNKWHDDLSDEDAYKALPNARYASHLSNRGDHFAAWAAYTSGAYLRYWDEVEPVHAYGTWRLRIPMVTRKFGDG
jgi:hypothetical protein